ncbi:MICOS complex subunit mic10 [Grifola frondosa]|uniref:MICOS complex subunit MIC10 n=1 Tax=Grifola frondosa TaxID=5627 RepID=A0A1C7MHZ2_GRIFR|nr:MICOS complex subunit mic10 [Grifola frondosa]
MSSTSNPTSSENIVSQKYDRCLADLLVKSGVGFSAGVIASVILFRRECPSLFLNTTHTLLYPRHLHLSDVSTTDTRTYGAGRAWPVALGTGFGMGAAYADCDRSFNPARIPGTRVIPQPAQPEAEKQ